MNTAEEDFGSLEDTARKDGTGALLDKLTEILRREKKFSQLFEARLMKKRQELGLPLLGVESLRDLPEGVQVELENYYIEACREVGSLLLEAGDIPGAWPYFRAIDEPKKVADALESWEPATARSAAATPATVTSATVTPDPGVYEDSTRDTIIDIALNQGANPRRGYELVLAHYGVCRAITIFEHQFSFGGEVKEACGALLIRRLYRDLLESIRSDVARREGTAPEGADIRGLIEGRPWLFEDHGYHVDMSHLQAVIRVAAGMKGEEELKLAIQMTEYGRRLPRDFQNPDRPPFEDFYNDYRIFLQALVGTGVDGAVRYFTLKADGFQQKADGAGFDEDGKHFPGEILVYLLYRAGRYRDAIEAHRKYLKNCTQPLSAAPPLLELCERAGDYSKALEAARERGDLLQFTAGLVRKLGVQSSD